MDKLSSSVAGGIYVLLGFRRYCVVDRGGGVEGIDFPTTVASVLKRRCVVETEIRGEGETIHKYHILR